MEEPEDIGNLSLVWPMLEWLARFRQALWCVSPFQLAQAVAILGGGNSCHVGSGVSACFGFYGCSALV
jgi:hypothetical protein